MRHLCKNLQKAVKDTASRFLAIISITGPSLSGTTPVPEGFSRVQITHHKFIPVPAFDPAFVITAGNPQAGTHPDIAVLHNTHNDDCPWGPFLHRAHRVLISLGLWEVRIVAFVLGIVPLYVGLNRTLALTSLLQEATLALMVSCGIGVLLRMFWVLIVSLMRSIRNTPQHEEETIFVFAEEAAS